jgi:phospholipase/carboxylesterase
VILLHGYGANQHDLVSLANELRGVSELRGTSSQGILSSTHFIFPNAPLEAPMTGGGRAWSPIDMHAIQMAMMRGEHRDLSGPAPAEFFESLTLLHSFVLAELKRLGLGLRDCVVGGFSQGSMMAIALALTLPEPPAGVLVWSGNLVDRAQLERWLSERTSQLRGLPFFQCHGTQDPILGVRGAKALYQVLMENGLAGEPFHEFRGAHEIPFSVVQHSRAFLEKVLGGAP